MPRDEVREDSRVASHRYRNTSPRTRRCCTTYRPRDHVNTCIITVVLVDQNSGGLASRRGGLVPTIDSPTMTTIRYIDTIDNSPNSDTDLFGQFPEEN